MIDIDRPQVTQWLIRIAWYIPKATNTHPEYAILIVFPLQQWLNEHAAMLRYTYIACLVLPSLSASYPCRLSRNHGLIIVIIERI